jgi:hypothetical protein
MEPKRSGNPELSQPQCTNLPAVKRFGSSQKRITLVASEDVTREPRRGFLDSPRQNCSCWRGSGKSNFADFLPKNAAFFGFSHGAVRYRHKTLPLRGVGRILLNVLFAYS